MTLRLTRMPDWPERLAAHIQAYRAAPFGWGTHDCVTFAAGAVAAITGQAVLHQAMQWASSRSAAAVLQCHGGMAAAVDRLLPRLPAPRLAQRGDLLLVQVAPSGPAGNRRPRRQFLAVADSVGWWAPGRQGLVAGDPAAAVIAWGVAHG